MNKYAYISPYDQKKAYAKFDRLVGSGGVKE